LFVQATIFAASSGVSFPCLPISARIAVHLVEAARDLLAVAGDERDGGVLREELGHRGHAALGQAELAGDLGDGIEGRRGAGLAHAGRAL
jgi:hypothetical protein